MDPNLQRNIGYFSVPNNQTINSVDQAANLAGPTSAQQPSLWDASALAAAGRLAESPSTAATSLSLDSMAGSSTAPTSIALGGAAMTSPSIFGQSPRSILPARPPRPRDAHERKRSRLNTDATPFDSVDYWIQFDNEEQNAENPNASAVKTDAKQKGKATLMEPPSNITQGMPAASGSQQTLKLDDTLDEALENALSDDEEGFSSMNLADHLSKIDSMPPSEIPPREGLYSTPLSWEKPQMGLRLDSLIGLQTPVLSEDEQRRLIAIAMNPGSSTGGLGSNINMNFGGASGIGSGFGSTVSMSQVSNSDLAFSEPFQRSQQAPPRAMRPQPQMQPQTQSQAQSQAQSQPDSESLNEGGSEKGKEKPKPGDRTAHNDIERKYRTNLKDKIAELRDAVPALRSIPENSVDDGESSNQPQRAPKVSKGTVLTKATEYIHHLEKRNKMIMQQHQELSRRLQAFEQLLSATARPTFQMPNYSRTLFDPRAFC